jgi:hypothetical protein
MLPRHPLVFACLVSLVGVAALPAARRAQEPPVSAPSVRPARTGVPREAPPMPLGTFFAARIDRETLPVTDRVVDDDSTLYVIEFDRLVLTLRADFTFRASVRYRRTLYSSDPRGRVRQPPLQAMTVTGRWDVAATEIRFVPDPGEDARKLRMMTGTIGSLRELTVPFHYRNGTQERERTLVLRRRDDIL